MTEARRGTAQRFNSPYGVHEFTFSIQNRLPLLRHAPLCEILAVSINDAAPRYKAHVWAYVFMPEHVHLLVCFHTETYSVSRFLQSVKQPTALRCLRWIRKHVPKQMEALSEKRPGTAAKFWLPGGGYDRNLTSQRTIRLAVDYIHRNPVRRGLVQFPDEYQWSSARFCMSGELSSVILNHEHFPS